MHLILILFLLFNIKNIFSVDIGVISSDNTHLLSIKDAISKVPFPFDITFEKNDVTESNVLSYFEEFKRKELTNVFAYIPVDVIKPEDLERYAEETDTYVVNFVTHPILTCYERIIYGFDNCYEKYLVIDYYKHRYDNNVLLAEDGIINDCYGMLYNYLKFYGFDMKYSLKSSDIDIDITDFLSSMNSITGKTVIYNFIPNKVVDLNGITNDNVDVITFDYEDSVAAFFNEASINKHSLLANQFYISDSSSPLYSFTNEKILVYGLLNMLLGEIMQGIMDFDQIRLSLYNKEKLFGLILLENNRFVSPIYILQKDTSVATPVIEEIYKIIVDNEYKIYQVNGFPPNQTCNLINYNTFSTPTYNYVIVISNIEGNIGYLDGLSVDGIELGINDSNNDENYLGNEFVMIFVDGSKSVDNIRTTLTNLLETHGITAIMSFIDIAKMIDIRKGWDIPTINFNTVSGDLCDTEVINMTPSTIVLMKESLNTIITDYTDIFILYSTGRSSTKSFEIISNYINDYSLKLIGSYKMEYDEETHANNAMSEIESKCSNSDKCMIISVIEKSFIPFFMKRFNVFRKRNINKYKLLSYNIDEKMIEMYGDGTDYDGIYIISPFFDSVNTDEGELLREELKKWNDNPVLTSSVTMSYAGVRLFVELMKMAISTDTTSLRRYNYLF